MACGAGRGATSAAAALSFSRLWGLDLLSCLCRRCQAAGYLYNEKGLEAGLLSEHGGAGRGSLFSTIGTRGPFHQLTKSAVSLRRGHNLSSDAGV